MERMTANGKKVGRPKRVQRPEVVAAQELTLPEVTETLARWQQWAADQPTAFGRLLASRWLIAQLRHGSGLEEGVGTVRTAAARELNMAGWSLREIAEVADVSVSRVQQWLGGNG
jgi:hypothetical protein